MGRTTAPDETSARFAATYCSGFEYMVLTRPSAFTASICARRVQLHRCHKITKTTKTKQQITNNKNKNKNKNEN
jgi:hypothetical protein